MDTPQVFHGSDPRLRPPSARPTIRRIPGSRAIQLVYPARIKDKNTA